MKHRTEQATGNAILVILVLALIALFVSGCSSWQAATGKTLQTVHETAKASSGWVENHYRVKCGAIAEARDRPKLEACQAERNRINVAIKLTHASVKALTEVLPLIEQARVAGGGE